MSRSYRKQPFMAIAGNVSSKKDKQIAHRCERRTHKRLITLASKEADFEDFVPPLRSECSHNNVYGWNRDGHQTYQVPDARDWHHHLMALDPDTHCQHESMRSFYKEYYSEWPPSWYPQIMRK